MNKTKILDCTLRDGGYYNEWDFGFGLADSLFTSLNDTGIDIVEVGYKAPPQPGFAGLYRYCPESQLERLRKLSRVQYAFMIDAKEFLGPDLRVDRNLVRAHIRPRAESIFSWCRIATHQSTLEGATELVREIRDLGYQVCFNAMGFSLLTEQQISETLRKVAAAGSDVFYFADSFGSLRPEDVLRYLRLIRSEYGGAIGIHTHDNQGLAFANSEAAIDAGVDYVDGTVMGMGRGAGNLKLEQLLLSLYFRGNRQDLNPYALVDLIETHFEPLHREYRWGWDFSYMLSGLQNIHPTYCQKLKSSHQFTLGQVAGILREIPPAKRSSFNAALLAESTARVLPRQQQGGADRVTPPQFTAPAGVGKVLVVGTGPSVREHAAALRGFIDRHRPLVIECNHSGALDGVPRLVAALNEVRLAELSTLGQLAGVEAVLTGLDTVPADLVLPHLHRVPCRLKAATVAFGGGQVEIPAFVVGMFAVAVAASFAPQQLYVAGFDGFADPARKQDHAEMQGFWDQLARQLGGGAVPVSLLPTTYTLPTSSVYGLLD